MLVPETFRGCLSVRAYSLNILRQIFVFSCTNVEV